MEQDRVRFDLHGCVDRYYKIKLPRAELRTVGIEYLTGLQWVMKYYYAHVPCWNWCVLCCVL